MAVNKISRTDAEVLIPEEISPDIIQGAIENSVALSSFRALPNMASNVKVLPVLETLPTAYWVDPVDTGYKQTTNVKWDKVKLYAEEIAVIVPIPENVLDDAASQGYDIWGQVRPRIVAEFGRLIDDAIIFGNVKPATWRPAIVPSAIAAGNVTPESGDLWADIMGPDGIIAHVEKSGFLPTGSLSSVRMRGILRNLRDDNNQPIFKSTFQNAATYDLDGIPAKFVINGSWDDTQAKLLVGDMSQAVYSIRQDITYKMLTEAVIQDPVTKEIVYNLAQQDMVALRVTMRLGWALPNPITMLTRDRSQQFPFAVLTPGE